MGSGRGKRQKGRSNRGGGSGSVRIISGDWRGRKISVADVPGLRPSGDRARETLFNWLQGAIPGSRCADLFAGTGVLGLEAASRGASEVTLIERSREAADQLRETVGLLNANQVSVLEGDAIEWLRRQAVHSLDVVFIDPPFDTDLAETALGIIRDQQCLASDGLVYVECPRLVFESAPQGWMEVSQKVMGEVRMLLLKPVEGV